MIQENKDLLLKYLCMALPYWVKVYCGEDLAMTLKQIDYNCFCECWENEDLKCNSRWMLPYLRPMSSMTEKEAKEIAILCLLDSRNILSIKITDEYLDVTIDDGISSTETRTLWYDELISSIECLYWLLKNHFDFMGLIPKGLAIEVTEDNNPYESNM